MSTKRWEGDGVKAVTYSLVDWSFLPSCHHQRQVDLVLSGPKAWSIPGQMWWMTPSLQPSAIQEHGERGPRSLDVAGGRSENCPRAWPHQGFAPVSLHCARRWDAASNLEFLGYINGGMSTARLASLFGTQISSEAGTGKRTAWRRRPIIVRSWKRIQDPLLDGLLAAQSASQTAGRAGAGGRQAAAAAPAAARAASSSRRWLKQTRNSCAMNSDERHGETRA